MKMNNTHIIRSKRKTLSVEITEGGSVVVRAPLRMRDRDIDRFLAERAGWIHRMVQKQRTAFAARPKRRFETGESFFYLGKPYALRFDPNLSRSIICEGDLCIREDVSHKAQSLIETWYKSRARFIFQERVQVYAPAMNAPYISLRLSSAKTRWGSCGAENTLNFNWRLVMAPLAVIDSVIVHELAHIHHKNHGVRFKRLVERHAPDYKACDAWLKENRLQIEW